MKRAWVFLSALSLAGCPGTTTPTDSGSETGADTTATDATDITTTDVPLVDSPAADAPRADAVDVAVDTFVPEDAPPLVDAAACDPDASTPPADDPLEAMRRSCAFQAGAMPSDTVGDFSAARGAIANVIVIMQENHSLDNIFGQTGHGIEGPPANASNNDSNGVPIMIHHEDRACTPNPGLHQWDQMHQAWDNGAMDGFGLAAGSEAATSMGYYDDNDHPFYTWAATTFATADHYFADVLSGTWSNRMYFVQGSRYGVYFTGFCTPMRNSPTVLEKLVAAGVQWGAYVGEGTGGGQAFEGALCFNQRTGGVPPQVTTLDDFNAALDAGTLPPVSFVETGENVYDEHPPANVHVGEDKVRELTARIMASPLWAHTALFITYDEGGGYYDHMPPPPACAPDSYSPPGNAQYADSLDTVYGVRVPFILVSPFARPGYVSHRVHSHASILRFIEALHGLPALTARDANSDALLDLFDFSCASFPTAPTDVPAAGSGTMGCP